MARGRQLASARGMATRAPAGRRRQASLDQGSAMVSRGHTSAPCALALIPRRVKRKRKYQEGKHDNNERVGHGKQTTTVDTMVGCLHLLLLLLLVDKMCVCMVCGRTEDTYIHLHLYMRRVECGGWIDGSVGMMDDRALYETNSLYYHNGGSRWDEGGRQGWSCCHNKKSCNGWLIS